MPWLRRRPAGDSPLRHRDFALYVAATVATAFAIEMSFVAIGWQVYAIHRDPLDLGIVGLAMFLPLPLLALPAAAKERADHYEAMTYNIRLDIASDGGNAWPHRRAALTALVAYQAPDLVGMQEVLQHQKQAVEADLPAYQFVGVARNDGKAKGEYSMLGFRRDRFALVGSGTFWLSPTPDVPSKGWDAALPRVASWARLKDKTSRLTLLAVNTHFDHIGTEARLESARQIRRWIGANRKKGETVVLMGDFNSPLESPPHNAITHPVAGQIALQDTLAISRTPHFGPLGTFTGFRIERNDPSPIDHIFVNDGTAVLRHATLTRLDIPLRDVHGFPGRTRIGNSVIVDNRNPDVYCFYRSFGGNLLAIAPHCTLWSPGPGDRFVEFPLGELADLGGFSRVHPLPAEHADSALDEFCTTFDQRGIARPFDGDGDGLAACDAGAMERVPERIFTNAFEP